MPTPPPSSKTSDAQTPPRKTITAAASAGARGRSESRKSKPGARALRSSVSVSGKPLHPQTHLEIMKRDVLGVAARGAQHSEHATRADVVERVDDDCCVALRGRVFGEPAGDGVACALVVGFVREVVLFGEVVVEEDGHVVPLREPTDSGPHVAGHVEAAPLQPLAEPCAARLVVLDDEHARPRLLTLLHQHVSFSAFCPRRCQIYNTPPASLYKFPPAGAMIRPKVIVATWNVNSVLARLDVVRRWLAEARPDLLCMQ